MLSVQSAEQQLKRQIYIYTSLVASPGHDDKNPTRCLAVEREATRTLEISAQSKQQMLDKCSSYIKTYFLAAPMFLDEEMALVVLVKQKAALILPQLSKKQNELMIHEDQQAVVQSNEQMLSVIVQSLFTNANNHTCRGVIRLGMERHADQVRLTISNTGAGLPETFLKWIKSSPKIDSPFQYDFYQAGSYNLCLLIMKELTVLLKIKIHSETQNGTRIDLTFSKPAA